MRKPIRFCFALTVCAAAIVMAQDAGVVKPAMVVQEVVQGMPRGASQEVRILTAQFKPGDRTVFHTHPFPVAVYVLEGTFTLELEGRTPTVIQAGQGFVEPPNVRMTGFNRATGPLRVVIFYVSDPNAPFLNLVH